MFPFRELNKDLLVFDSAPSHMSKKVTTHLQTRKIMYAVISGGLTSYRKPCEYVVFKPLKERPADLIDNLIKPRVRRLASHEFAAAFAAAFLETMLI